VQSLDGPLPDDNAPQDANGATGLPVFGVVGSVNCDEVDIVVDGRVDCPLDIHPRSYLGV